MKCPACSNTLTEITIGKLAVDVCRKGCGGAWFDWFEIQRVDEKQEAAGEALLNIETDPGIKVDTEARRKCPRCGDRIMMRHFWSVKREVVVDECPECGGVWLDAGELARIRSQFEDVHERKQAAQKLFGDMVAEEFGEKKTRGEKAKGMSRLFGTLLKD